VRSAADELQDRVSAFACRVLKFVEGLRRSPAIDAVAYQLSRSATGTSGNYRSTRRSRSRAEFIARLGVVLEEADETTHWLEVLRGGNFVSDDELELLLDEGRQLRAIFAKSLHTARSNRRLRTAAPKRSGL
jgi:four helix bundle protein